VTSWTPERIRALADRMASRLGREVRVSPVTLPVVITALRDYADDLAAASALGTAEYQVREWDAEGGLIRELAVCRDPVAAHGAFEAAAFANPGAYLTTGQNARVIRAHGPGQRPEERERKLLPVPKPEPESER
jgi:hypothetical protein